MQRYQYLFSPVQVGKTTLKNRIIFAPMGSNYAQDNGSPSALLNAYYLERARGGAGLIITEAAILNFPSNKSLKRQLSFSDSDALPDWSSLTEAVHVYGAKIIAQVNDNGFRVLPENNSHWKENVSPSPSAFQGKLPGRMMSQKDIQDYIGKYVSAARMMLQAGMDGIELHACHGDLQNQFLSPLTNYRTDEYGGSVENRARFLTEAVAAIRKDCGDSFLISVRLPVKDYFEGGLTPEETASIAALCEAAGADMISCSTGFASCQDQISEGEYSAQGARVFLADAVKAQVKTAAVAAVGKLTDPAFCEEVLKSGRADLIVMGRQLICDPYWPEKVRCGREEEIRPCLYCREGCIGQLEKGHAIRCALNPIVGYENLYHERLITPVAVPKKCLVVGGGLAGMQAAITARKRGHKVTIVEKSVSLGGQMRLAGVPPHKERLLKAMDWFRAEVARLGIPVIYKKEADLNDVILCKPDVVIWAVGSVPFSPPIPGIEKSVEAWSLLSGYVELPVEQDIVVIGGGTVGCESALLLMERGNRVSVLEMAPAMCGGQEEVHRNHLLAELNAGGVQLLTGCSVQKISDNAVFYRDSKGKECSVSANLVVAACGQRPALQSLLEEVRDHGILAYEIGDALKTGNLRSAVRAGFDIAMGI